MSRERLGCFNKRLRIASKFSTKLYEITCSNIFRESELNERSIRPTQAFMLLWQDWFTGDVDGLWSNTCRLAAAYSCVLLELIALGKITFKKKEVFGGSTIYIKVVDQQLTDSYLDRATFSDLIRLSNSNKQLLLVERISNAAKRRWRSRRNCATLVLDSLEEMNILERDKECLGLRRLYRTKDLDPHGLLEKEIRSITLKSRTPDTAMRILLTLCNMADFYASKSNKLLKRYFTKNECADAMERIDMLSRDWSVDGCNPEKKKNLRLPEIGK